MISALAGLGSLVAVLGAVFGLLIGSFLNVVAYRVPAGLSVVAPPSACPNCGHSIRGLDNIPVVSWLILRGRCRSCRDAISVRYPIIEALTGGLFVLVAVRFWDFASADTTDARTIAARLIALAAFLYLMAVSVALAAIDLDTHMLPNAIVLPSYAVVGLLLTASALLAGDPAAVGRAAIGFGALGAFYLVLALAMPGGMGLGDVKLAGLLGFALGYLGWEPLLVGSFGAFALGGTFGLILLLTRRAGRRSGIPFGPWMLAGAWLGVFAGPALAHLYLTATGLA